MIKSNIIIWALVAVNVGITAFFIFRFQRMDEELVLKTRELNNCRSSLSETTTSYEIFQNDCYNTLKATRDSLKTLQNNAQ